MLMRALVSPRITCFRGLLAFTFLAAVLSSTGTALAATPTQITAGVSHGCALRDNGTVRCWGGNWFGQLGNGATVDSTIPVSVTGITNATQVAAGGYHACVLLSDGTVKCWGLNSDGQLGNGATSNSRTPLGVTGITNAIQITAGAYHTCALLADQTLKCWGRNTSGQLGNGTKVRSSTPVAVTGITTATQITAGGYHSCALLSGGAIKCWGGNYFGPLGTNDRSRGDTTTPAAVYGISNATQVVGGSLHSCALLADQTVQCWGYDMFGQTGEMFSISDPYLAYDCKTDPRGMGNQCDPIYFAPRPLAGITAAIQVAAGGNPDGYGAGVGQGEAHSCALLKGGAITCWGDNSAGQLGVTTLTDATQIVAGALSTCALRTGGTIACRGALGYVEKLDPPAVTRSPSTQFTSKSVSITVSANTGTTLKCTLDNNQPTACTSPVQLTNLSEGQHTLGITQNPIGNSTESDPVTTTWTVDTVAPLAPVVTTKPSSPSYVRTATFAFTGEADARYACSIDAGAYASCTGPVSFTNLSEGSHSFRVKQTDQAGNTSEAATSSWDIDLRQVAVGDLHSCALLTGGSVKCWGRNSEGQLGAGSSTPDSNAPVAVAGLTSATQIAGGGSHSCALLGDQTIRCWGANGDGRLGDGTTFLRTTPVAVTGVSTAIQIVAGRGHSCALLLGGTVTCWGWNIFGQLGNGSTANSSNPVSVSGIADAIQITTEASSLHTCALLKDGAVRCWGRNVSGQLGSSTTCSGSGFQMSCTDQNMPVAVTGITNATQITVSGDHTCALLADATVKCWGSNGYGELGDPTRVTNSSTPVAVTGITNATQVTGGLGHSCALLNDSTIKCWGYNDYGQLGSGSTAFMSSTPVAVATITTARQITAGGNHSCALLKDGTTQCWGRNTHGELGNATNTNSNKPVTVTTASAKPVPPTITRTPNAPFTGANTSITIDAIAGAKLTCTLDGNAPATCTNPLQLSKLADGTHTLAVTQTNNGSQTPSEPATVTWTVDTAVPVAPVITTKPQALSNSATAIFAFTGEANASFTCSIDNGSYTPCQSPTSFGKLAEGSHSFSVKQADQAGNTSPAATGSWTSDAVPPTAPSISSKPSSVTKSSSASIKFTGSESGGSFECSVDTGSYSACSSPKGLTGLAEGPHALAVRQVDHAGNTGPEAMASWIVDSTAPGVPVLSGQPAARTNSTSAAITFTGEASASFTCSVNGRPYVACGDSPRSFSGLSAGSKSLSVKQTDLAGNTSAAATASWVVDLTAPASPSLISKPASSTRSLSASFGFSGEANASFLCSIDGGSFDPCSSPVNYGNLTERSHSFSVKQTDEAGNTGSASTLFTWNVDLTPPSAPVFSAAPAALTHLSTAKTVFSAETDKTFRCSLDGATPSACTSPVSLSGLAEGNHTFVVSHSDPAGNASSASAAWLVDTTPPTLSTENAVAGKTKTTTQTTYNLSVNSDVTGIAKVEYSTATKAPAINASSVAARTVLYATPVVFVTGSKITWIRIQDGAGNWSQWYPA